jgi:CheY-like chemotaxis protein
VKILLAEDNPVNQKVAEAILHKAGYPVHIVENGLDVVKALRSDCYNLVLMDVQMPEVDGIEATRRVREMEGDERHTPIVAMTAHAMSGDKEKCLKSGMDDYIAKPIRPSDLLDMVEKWTQSQKDSTKREMTSTSTGRGTGNHQDDILDIEEALERFDGDREFYEEMLQDFIEYGTAQVQTIEEAIGKGNPELLAREAHSLKGAAANLSANRLSRLAVELEQRALEGRLEDGHELLERLKEEIRMLQQFREEIHALAEKESP